jgi:hypothetical protein
MNKNYVILNENSIILNKKPVILPPLILNLFQDLITLNHKYRY